ncbi:bifunctional molybdenum cofactor guanylyltransferase MobA/molybdopterin-guanine dinucleotide biosynthesis adaptor protein MobB [Chlorobium limicola]|uniref:Probable molybdenum cofactor guanylyltransferase n=1 Tax=Chlorobium limicola TaxID=1092 RepID=A0A101JQV9_CHLLI|nr:bifunctional molybdenum cofactor guanylyltransferase MobA/molybdopterin-guanine dinucleotide biosynthesis adaptor protein MobB [Chlorobium limicola]KUL31382.1 bifunctional molybdopterin-guanine dinucleotide biosynthesis protein MobB/MobA [Chlorobium limicola]
MLFHPFEIALSGFSGSGKTTLAAAIVSRLAENFTVGCYKHGCHRFDIDREGKDSHTLKKAGAETVMISDPEKKAVVTGIDNNGLKERMVFLDCDLLLVEGLKELPLPKLLLVDREKKILELLAHGDIPEVVALVDTGEERGSLGNDFDLPSFHRNDIETITAFIESFLAGKASETELSGLILAGGRSSRMGADKALLSYHEENQIVHTATLLRQHCREIFISCRNEQAQAYEAFGFPIITDRYLETGPAGGILSAQQNFPDRALFAVACDMPFLDATLISKLVENRKPLRYATAFRHESSGHIEPLCACYEPKSRKALLASHAENNNSLQSFLDGSRIGEITLSESRTLSNINDPASMQAALKACRSPKG